MWSILNYVIVEVDISELFGRRNIVHYLTVDLEKIAKLVHYISYFHYLAEHYHQVRLYHYQSIVSK